MKPFVRAFLLLLTGCSANAHQNTAAFVHGLALGLASPRPSYGQTIYAANECTGPVIMGVCHGGIIPVTAYHPRCYGTMLNGTCTGPLF